MDKNEPFRIQVNGHHALEVLPEDARHLDLIPDGEQSWHVLQNGRSYHAELVAVDPVRRQYTVRINGNLYTVDIADRYARLVQQLGLQVGGTPKFNVVKAPMPGLVLQILVAPGQSVQKGDSLLLLEAMKMENVIKAAGDGVVKAVHVEKGMAVDKGAVLLEL